jgi:hypothetical protein
MFAEPVTQSARACVWFAVVELNFRQVPVVVGVQFTPVPVVSAVKLKPVPFVALELKAVPEVTPFTVTPVSPAAPVTVKRVVAEAAAVALMATRPAFVTRRFVAVEEPTTKAGPVTPFGFTESSPHGVEVPIPRYLLVLSQ